MKSLFIISVLLLAGLNGFGQEDTVSTKVNYNTYKTEIDSIVISYLDWNFRTRGRLSAKDVKNFRIERKKKYVIQDSRTIDKFIKAISLVHLKFLNTQENADIRMVLEFYHSNEVLKEISLDYTRAIHIDNNFYRSISLYFLIEDEIPPITKKREQ
jgi:hypothetical protein